MRVATEHHPRTTGRARRARSRRSRTSCRASGPRTAYPRASTSSGPTTPGDRGVAQHLQRAGLPVVAGEHDRRPGLLVDHALDGPDEARPPDLLEDVLVDGGVRRVGERSRPAGSAARRAGPAACRRRARRRAPSASWSTPAGGPGTPRPRRTATGTPGRGSRPCPRWPGRRRTPPRRPTRRRGSGGRVVVEQRPKSGDPHERTDRVVQQDLARDEQRLLLAAGACIHVPAELQERPVVLELEPQERQPADDRDAEPGEEPARAQVAARRRQQQPEREGREPHDDRRLRQQPERGRGADADPPPLVAAPRAPGPGSTTPRPRRGGRSSASGTSG